MAAKWSGRMRRIAGGPLGLVAAFLWALAESLVWPLIPDSFLMALVLAAPGRLGRLWGATVAGTVTGGLVGLRLSGHGLTWPLPLVTGRMREAANGWLAAGAPGLAHQPLSGVPYKAFVSQAADHGIEPLDWAMATLVYRGGRMAAAAVVAAGAGWVLWKVIPQRLQARIHGWTVGIATSVLFFGLYLIVRTWS